MIWKEKMKSAENKRWILMTAIILMLCVSSLCEGPIRTEAASKISRQKNGLQKKGRYYYFYKNGKKQKGWVSFGRTKRFFRKSDGRMVTNQIVNSRRIDSKGIYRCGRREAVERLYKKIIAKITKKKMTRSQKLRTCYKWLLRCHYLPVSPYPSEDTKYNGWDVAYASNMLKIRGGNCFSYSCAFAFLARCLGYDAKIVVGRALDQYKNHFNEHCWVEIKGKVYDPERESFWKNTGSMYGKSYSELPYKYTKVFEID